MLALLTAKGLPQPGNDHLRNIKKLRPSLPHTIFRSEHLNVNANTQLCGHSMAFKPLGQILHKKKTGVSTSVSAVLEIWGIPPDN